MKTLNFLLLFSGFLTLSFQSNAESPFDKFYEKYATKEGYTSVNISKDMFQLFAGMSDDKDSNSLEMKKMMSQLNGLKVLTCKPDSLKPGKATAFMSEANALFNPSVYKELMVVNDGGNNIRFLTKSDNKGKIAEMVMLARSKEEMVVLDMTGTIDLATVSKLSKSMNIHGMENLQKMHNNKK